MPKPRAEFCEEGFLALVKLNTHRQNIDRPQSASASSASSSQNRSQEQSRLMGRKGKSIWGFFFWGGGGGAHLKMMVREDSQQEVQEQPNRLAGSRDRPISLLHP